MTRQEAIAEVERRRAAGLVLVIGARITGDYTRGHRNHPNRGR